MSRLGRVLTALFLMNCGLCQLLAADPQFEVASIKLHDPSIRPGPLARPQPGGIRLVGVSLRTLISMAWELRGQQLITPSWADGVVLVHGCGARRAGSAVSSGAALL